ncbi:DUF3987 domain-containing protein [Hymenobacter coccineus]|uniref:Uncharacterized protein n=1 Tax=Hymenobacter coccineus TaxID=1908235 RepID=A0A1G1SWC8_9BACT|nr:DUF3987 domain-containing protein [Hymenobacter coccineus]OGX82899.1 hypothetical protein BEN49_13170 [Hymenobacter coccineus]
MKKDSPSAAPTGSTPAAKFSLYTGGISSVKPNKSVTLAQAHKRLVSDQYAETTAAIRELPADSVLRKKRKLALDYVTAAGVFSTRSTAGLLTRSGLLVLDFDHVRNLRGLRRHLLCDPVLGPSVVLLFVSPSGDGLKVFVAVDLRFDHKCSFDAVTAHLRATCPNWFKRLDIATNDIARGCLLCHDPDAYLSPQHESPTPFPQDPSDLFEVSGNPFEGLPPTGNAVACLEPWICAVEASTDFPDDYDRWYRIGLALANLGEDGREYFHRVSRLSPKYKEAECDRQFSLSLRKGSGAITVGTFVHICKEAGICPDNTSSGEEPPEGDPTPCMPDGLFPRLPTFLQQCCSPFKSRRERDVMLIGTLAVLSGCFAGVGGTYNRRAQGLNLYAFIIAPAASGKGTLAWARYLARPWHQELIEESKMAKEMYEAQLKASKDKDNPVPPPIGPPPRQQLFLPANTTAAAILTQLADNGGRGIICETEADTLSGALGADFGNFSDMLRKAFHHEPVSALRKTDNQYTEIERPALSIALTGTPDQVSRLLKSADDGLVSRMLFYTFAQTPAWQDVGPQAGPSLDEHFRPLAAQLLQFIQATPGPTPEGSCPVQITLADADWARLNEAGAAGLTEAHDAAGGAGASTAFRLGLIAWRIAALLTVLRCYDDGEVPTGTIEALPGDVTLALTIMDTVRAHALAVLDRLAPVGKPNKAGSGRHTFRTEHEPRVRELRAQIPPVSYARIQELTGVPSNTACNWMKS